MHVLAIIACFWNHLPLSIQSLFGAVVLISAVFHWQRRHAGQFKLRYSESHGWRLQTAPSTIESIVRIHDSTALTRWFIALHIQTAQNPHQTLLIFNDALDKADYRRLLVMLKIVERD